jgi:hypothetical protein
MQYLEALAGGGPGQAQGYLILAHAEHSPLKQLEHLNPVRRDGKGLHELDEIFQDIQDIVETEYIEWQWTCQMKMFTAILSTRIRKEEALTISDCNRLRYPWPRRRTGKFCLLLTHRERMKSPNPLGIVLHPSAVSVSLQRLFR